MIAYVFPGQGSQNKGMGRGLFRRFKEFTKVADDILGFSIEALCMEDANERLSRTEFTQPALYVVNAFNYMAACKDNTVKPAYVAGHSLGEYNALLAAEAFDFETGLILVKKRGELMATAKEGGMAAVIGLTENNIRTILRTEGLARLDIANLNAPLQVVLSGPRDDIHKAKSIFEAQGCRAYIVLNVSGAFHSKMMQSCSTQYRDFLRSIRFSDVKIPVIANVNARPYDCEQIPAMLTDQITHAVQWTASIRYLLDSGVREFIEIGPGKVLHGLIRSIKQDAGISDRKTQYVHSSVPPVKNKPQPADKITMKSLGSHAYKDDYNVKYAYAAGGMVHGIASKELVIKMGRAGMIGYFGTGGLKIDEIEKNILDIQDQLTTGDAYGMNLLHSPMEGAIVDLYLKHGVRNIEAAAYIQISKALVKFRLKGLHNGSNGKIRIKNKVMAKLSRPEVAIQFLSPAPDKIVKQLLQEGAVTPQQADLAANIPMADDICVESDSGGHTDKGIAFVLLPAIQKLRDDMMRKYNFAKTVRVGAAGGIGTPAAAAASFILGADFILTGSINQCTVEASISSMVKDLLQQINVQDTEYAPAGDMFEIGARVQVLKRGVFFPARANKLYDLYKHYNSIDEIDAKTKKQLQEKFFKRSFEEIYAECQKYYPPEEIKRAEKNPKKRMALIFRWYFGRAMRWALKGEKEHQLDFQIHCGPALGSFNQWVKDTDLEDWKNRHVDGIAKKLLNETAATLNRRFEALRESV
jgi:trans-AT polyketide synthase/acyltransferase/oxidoreductase domain-containing protein